MLKHLLNCPRRIPGRALCINRPISYSFAPRQEAVAPENATQTDTSARASSNSDDTAAHNETSKTDLVPIDARAGHDPSLPKVKEFAFDTQKVYANLRYAGYTSAQADTLLNVMQELVDGAIEDVSKYGLPKSAGQNEAYLFSAALSETRDAMYANRFNNIGQLRSSLTRIQREFEMLRHESEEMSTMLKAHMDMEMNERKNAARVDENNIQLKIQELNHKVVRLITYQKGENENLRWELTRWGIIAVVVVSASIMYITNVARKEETPKTSRTAQESAGSEYTVPLLTPSVVPDELDEPNVEDLGNYESK